VDGVVPADVLTHADWIAPGGEESRGVQPAGALEHALARPQLLDQPGQQLRVDRRPGRQHREVAAQVLDQYRAANAAGGAGEHRTLGLAARHAREVDVDLIGFDYRSIDLQRGFRLTRFGADAELPDVLERPNDALGVHQAEGQLHIVARRAHDDGKVLTV